MSQIEIKTICLKENQGAGNALRIALENATYDLVARMDSDDISLPSRFQKQLECFKKSPDLDIVGGEITEFAGDESNIIWKRGAKASDYEIKKDMKSRCAMNHVSVMYRKEAVQRVGGYQDWPQNEDYYLWIRMILAECKFENVLEPLVNVRVGDDMSTRRGGISYFKSEAGIQKLMLDKNMISVWRYLYNVILRFGGEVVASNNLRSKLFKFFRESYPSDVVAGQKNEDVSLIDSDYPNFSVAMSVYGKDNPEWFDRAIESVINQTIQPSEIVLVVDGPVPDAIHDVIEKYVSKYSRS